jgi:propionate CoA-transferase
MKLADKLHVIYNLVRWRLTWSRRDTAYCPAGMNAPPFMSARDAVALIKDGSSVLSCGLASNARCSIFYWAVRERFENTCKPASLTWISVGAQGGRGRVPGTVEELALPGLVTRYISGHVETAKGLLKLADQGQLAIHLLPQGEMTLAIEAQGHGKTSVISSTGIGTFLDPRCGRGSPTNGHGEQYVQVAGEQLKFHLPAIDVAIINAPYADRQGNIYFRHAASMTESVEAAQAARHNGGLVLVSVASLIDGSADEVVLPSGMADAIVINPRNEQTGGIPQRRYWPLFTTDGGGDDLDAIQKLRYANDLLGLTPARGPVESAIARLGAQLFSREVCKGATVNLGVGYGEEVVRILCEQGLHRDVTFTTETGVYGGVPAPGIYFGAAVNPMRLESSAWMFRHYREHLDATVLGYLEVDSAGNVNGSERGEQFIDFVGPGGLPSIVAAARTIIFVGGWMSGGQWRIEGGELKRLQAGKPKFVDKVRVVTFNGSVALAQGKRVFYVTHVGVFRLTPKGLLLEQVMPGIDVQRDIIDASDARILLPENGDVPRVAEPVLTGDEYGLAWPSGQ